MTLVGPIIAVVWVINHVEFPIETLRNGTVTDISVNGNNLIVENIMINDDRNNTVYQCILLQLGMLPIRSYPITLYVAGECITISLFHFTINNNCMHSYVCMSPYSQYFLWQFCGQGTMYM